MENLKNIQNQKWQLYSYLSFCTWFNLWIPLFTNDVINVLLWTTWYFGERLFTVVSKIPVHTPIFSVVPRTLDVHGFRSERFKGHDQMSKHKLSFQINL